MKLKDYIQGERKGKEANRLERQAMKDPFLQEALDGFDATAGDHAQTIERLEQKFTQSETSKEIKTARKRLSIAESLIYVAASFLLIVGFGALFLWDRNSDSNTEAVVAMEEVTPSSTEMESVVAMEEPPPPMEPVVAMEELEQQSMDIEAVVAMEEPPPPSATEAIVAMEEPARQPTTADDMVQHENAAPKPSSKERETQDYGNAAAAKSARLAQEMTVKISFFVDETGKPTNIEFEEYTSEEAKKEVEKLLAAYPTWTQRNKKVTMTVTLNVE